MRGVLGVYYRMLRADLERDPSGLVTLCRVLGAQSAEAIDGEFRRWVGRR